MRVYHPVSRGNPSLFIQPANDPRAVAAGVASDWLDEQGSARMIAVEFTAGVAEVPDSIGRYLVATGQAKATQLWTPPTAQLVA